MAETLETLGEKLTAGLAAIATRFDTVDQRLEGVDRRLDVVDQRLEGVDRRLGAVDQRLEGVDRRFGEVDRRFDGVAREFTGIHDRFKTVDQRLDELGSSLRIQIEAVDNKVGLVLEKVGHLMARDIHHSGVNTRVDTRLDNHELRIIALESEKRGSQ